MADKNLGEAFFVVPIPFRGDKWKSATVIDASDSAVRVTIGKQKFAVPLHNIHYIVLPEEK